MDRAERLAALASFLACSEAEAERLNDAMAFVTCAHGQTLSHQGDLGAKVWIVLDGQAQLQVIGGDEDLERFCAGRLSVKHSHKKTTDSNHRVITEAGIAAKGRKL